MKRVCIICEGQTEVAFVTNCLAPYLTTSNLRAFAVLLQAPSGGHRGGRVTIERLVRFMSHQYHETDRLTTLVDFYGFQDREGRSRAELETAILDGVAQRTTGFDARFVLPYVQMHEFEGLLFSDVEQFEWVQDGWNEHTHAALSDVRASFPCPEDINDSPETAPSKRLLKIFGAATYSKTEHGPLIAEAIGLDVIRQHCPQFDDWVGKLQAWGNE